ncbi:hypothetical protein R3P38DRAFT_2780889 [Favolaschia claudopus]|uniref:Uncharacterized protein n=1 Tax=Favolaschia claudopus TaxID=2862362 RepID=A0AAW0B6H6_9AGAR
MCQDRTGVQEFDASLARHKSLKIAKIAPELIEKRHRRTRSSDQWFLVFPSVSLPPDMPLDGLKLFVYNILAPIFDDGGGRGFQSERRAPILSLLEDALRTGGGTTERTRAGVEAYPLS